MTSLEDELKYLSDAQDREDELRTLNVELVSSLIHLRTNKRALQCTSAQHFKRVLSSSPFGRTLAVVQTLLPKLTKNSFFLQRLLGLS